MTTDSAASRMVTIWAMVAAQAAGRGARTSVADVCAAAVSKVAVSGAGLIAMTQAGTVHVICVTDAASERLADIELTLGEGPCADTAAFGGPVLASDLADDDIMSRWPVFSPAAREAGVAAVFAFPLQIGAIRAGVLELYCRKPGPLSTRALGDALLFADTATLLLLDGQGSASGSAGSASGSAGSASGSAGDADGGTGPGGLPIGLWRRRAEIDQATGMLTEQLGVRIDEAFIRLRAHAYAHDRRLAEVAREIVTGRLRLRPDRESADPGSAG